MDRIIVALGPAYHTLINEPILFGAEINADPFSVSWLWDFGDGGTSNEMSPAYSYSHSGLYTICVTITDNKGRTDTSKTRAYIGKPPEKPIIYGPTICKPSVGYYYNFVTEDPDGDNVYYSIYWGHDYGYDTVGPYPSGMEVTLYHSWPKIGICKISCKAYDTVDLWSEEANFSVIIPRNRVPSSFFILDFLKQFQILREEILRFASR